MYPCGNVNKQTYFFSFLAYLSECVFPFAYVKVLIVSIVVLFKSYYHSCSYSLQLRNVLTVQKCLQDLHSKNP